MLIIFMIFCAGVIFLYNALWGPGLNNTDNYQLFIPHGASYEDVNNHLISEGLLKYPSIFDALSSRMNYKKDEVKSGRYVIPPEIGLRDLISKLRSGNQDAINITFNNTRTVEDLAGMLGRQIEPDSISLLKSFLDENNLQKNGLTIESATKSVYSEYLSDLLGCITSGICR